MASIDALAKGLPAPAQGPPSKPNFELEDKEFTTVRSVKAVATLGEKFFNDLSDDVREYVVKFLSAFEETPRTIKNEKYRKLLDDFMEEHGKGYWAAERRDYSTATHFVWPADKERIEFLCFALIRHAASRQMQKKRKAEALNGGSESKAQKGEGSDKEASKKDVSKGAKAKNFVAEPPKKKQRHWLFPAKKSTQDVQDEDSSDGPDGGDDKATSGTKKVTKLPGDPFTAVRNNLVAQNTTSSTQHTATPTPASKIAKLSSKQTTLIFDMSRPDPPHSAEAPRKPSDFSDCAMAPTKMANVVPKTVTGGAPGVDTAQAPTKSKDMQDLERERSLEEVRRGAKTAKEALAHVQDDAMSTVTVTQKGQSSPTGQNIFGPAARAEEEVMEGIEERDARQERVKSESIEAMGFDNLPVASASQESAKCVFSEPVVDSVVDTVAMAIAAEALQVQAAADAQASDGEDTIIVRPEMSVVSPTTTVRDSDNSMNKGVVDGSGAVPPMGTVARRSGATNPAKVKGGRKNSNTPDTKTGTVKESVVKRELSKDKPATPVSNAGSPLRNTSGEGCGREPESPARLIKNKDGSLARKPKSASTSATKEAASAKQAKPVLATTPTNPAAASTAQTPAATQTKPALPTSNGAVKKTAPADTHGKPATPTSTGAVKNATPTINPATMPPPSAPLAVMQSPQHPSTPADRPIIFLITIDSPTSLSPSTQIYHPFPLSTPFPFFSSTIAEQLGPDEKLVFASATKGQISYPGMPTARFPVAMPMVGMIWGNIMKKLAWAMGEAEGKGEGDGEGEVVTVTFS